MNLLVCAERACTLFGLSLPENFGAMSRLLKIAEAAAAMPECDRQAFCSTVWAHAEDVAQIVEKGERFSKLHSAFDSAFVESAWAASFDECRSILATKGRSWFRLLSSRYRAQVSLLKSYLKVPLPKSVEQRLLLVDGLIAAQLARRSFEELQEAGLAAFGAGWRKDRSDWAKLDSLTSWWSAFPKDGLPDDLRDRLARLSLTDDDRKSFASFRVSLEAAKAVIGHLIDFLELDLARIPVAAGDRMSIVSIIETVTVWRKSPERITRWIAFMDRIRIFRESGLGALAEGILNGSLTDASLVTTFERSYVEAMRAVIFAKHPELKRFDGEAHGRLVESWMWNACGSPGTRSHPRTPPDCHGMEVVSVRSVS